MSRHQQNHVRTMAPPQMAAATLPLHIADSWQRCRGMGLDSSLLPYLDPLPAQDIRHLLERDVQLASVAQGELQILSQALADTGHAVILIDDQGMIVSAAGDLAHTGPVLQRARRGVDASETHLGTSAPGTALVERRPIYVRGNEHYFRELRHLECLAAPIFQPAGELIGVLDISSDTRPLLPGLMDLVYSSVQRIERLLLRELCSPAILRLHAHPGCLGTAFEGLIALGEDGDIIGLNSLGARALGVGHADAVGRALGDLLSADALRNSRSGAPVSLRTRSGMTVFATLAEADDLRDRRGARPQSRNAGKAATPVQMPPAEPLTRRELKILGELESGLGNREIAQRLFISEGTLKWHLRNIYGKLGCKSRVGAIAAARKIGLY